MEEAPTDSVLWERAAVGLRREGINSPFVNFFFYFTMTCSSAEHGKLSHLSVEESSN